MNEDELKKEAWQYADKVCGWDKTQIFDYLVEAYLASAEPREKRIAELEAENEQIKNSDTLCKLIGEQKIKIAELEDKLANADYQLEGRDIKIKELEAQIEKMKCCGNCKHFDFNEPNYCHKGVYRERQYVCSEWEFGN